MKTSDLLLKKMDVVRALRIVVEDAETKAGVRLLEKARQDRDKALEALLLEVAEAVVGLLEEQEGAASTGGTEFEYPKQEPMKGPFQPQTLDDVASRLLGGEGIKSRAGMTAEEASRALGDAFISPRGRTR